MELTVSKGAVGDEIGTAIFSIRDGSNLDAYQCTRCCTDNDVPHCAVVGGKHRVNYPPALLQQKNGVDSSMPPRARREPVRVDSWV